MLVWEIAGVEWFGRGDEVGIEGVWDEVSALSQPDRGDCRGWTLTTVEIRRKVIIIRRGCAAMRKMRLRGTEADDL